MFGCFPPNSPFINQYDSRLSIRSRDYRAQLRVQELKDAGLFPCQVSPDGDARDDPPGKRQRTDSNPSYRPYQNYPPKPYHSATPSHIRFSGDQEKPWTPKRKLKESREGKRFTPASATPKSNMADRNQPGVRKGRRRKNGKRPKTKWPPPQTSLLTSPEDKAPPPRGRRRRGPRALPPRPEPLLPSIPRAPPPTPPTVCLGRRRRERVRRRRRRREEREGQEGC
ncbi:proline-rich proteoglycan 2-like [Oncorhynchus keta]|uniref:proline-rich proteoglycan 2-like n=1 Tax=Oncorhynchus keta TaxID=8018 RepID=UPI00227CCA69|nr:proline-rich proteoglycan 2-like [Oncorhynchus keta]